MILRACTLVLLLTLAPCLGAKIVDGGGTLTLDIDFRSTEDIIVKDSATLILRDMVLDMNQAYDDELVIRVEEQGKLIISNTRISSNKHLSIKVQDSASLEIKNSTVLVDEILAETSGVVTVSDTFVRSILSLNVERVTLLRSVLQAQSIDILATKEAKIDGCPDIRNLQTMSAPDIKVLDSVILTQDVLELIATSTSAVIANLTATAPAITLSSNHEIEIRDSSLSARGESRATPITILAPVLRVSTTKMNVADGSRADILLSGTSVDARNVTVTGSCGLGCGNITLKVDGTTLILWSLMANIKGGSGHTGTGENGANAMVIIDGSRLTANDITFTIVGGDGGEGLLIGGSGGNASLQMQVDDFLLDGALVTLTGGDGGDGGFDPGTDLRVGGDGGNSILTAHAESASIKSLTYNGLGGYPGVAGKGPGICGNDILTIDAKYVALADSSVDSNGGRGRAPNYMRKDSHGCDAQLLITGDTVMLERSTLRVSGGECSPSVEWAALGGNGFLTVTGERVNVSEITVRATGGSGDRAKEEPTFQAKGVGNLTIEGSVSLNVYTMDATANAHIESKSGIIRDMTVKGDSVLGGTLSLINPRFNNARSPLLGDVSFTLLDRYVLYLDVVYYLEVTVKDGEGKAFPGARVALYEPLESEPVYLTHTDDNGLARVEARAERINRQKDNFQGNFRVVATASGSKTEKGLILDSSKTLSLALEAVYNPIPTPTLEPIPGENGTVPIHTPIVDVAIPSPFPTPSARPVTAITATPPPDPTDMAARARALVKTQPLRALVMADEALKVDPMNRRAQLQRAAALEALERYVEAQRMYEIVLIEDPGDADVRARVEETKVKAQEVAAMAEAGEATEEAAGTDTWTIIMLLVGLLVIVFVLGVVMVIMSNPATQDRETEAIRSFALQWTQQGYTPEQVREYLQGMGYPVEKIDKVVQ